LNAEDGWSEAKKTWCCEREEKGCGEKRYDCDAGLSNAENGWSEAKKTWCCDHEEKGCGEVTSPSSAPTAAPTGAPTAAPDWGVEADIQWGSMGIAMVVVAAGGSFWTLCLCYAQQKRTPVPVRHLILSENGIEVYIDVKGDLEKVKDAPQMTETFCTHPTKELPREKNTAFPEDLSEDSWAALEADLPI
jgi:hypothetical protein